MSIKLTFTCNGVSAGYTKEPPLVTNENGEMVRANDVHFTFSRDPRAPNLRIEFTSRGVVINPPFQAPAEADDVGMGWTVGGPTGEIIGQASWTKNGIVLPVPGYIDPPPGADGVRLVIPGDPTLGKITGVKWTLDRRDPYISPPTSPPTMKAVTMTPPDDVNDAHIATELPPTAVQPSTGGSGSFFVLGPVFDLGVRTSEAIPLIVMNDGPRLAISFPEARTAPKEADIEALVVDTKTGKVYSQ